MQNEEKFLYSQPVLDFVTVATEYCKYVEQCSQTETNDFCRVMRGLLPMIYLKATLLEEVPETAGWNEKTCHRRGLQLHPFASGCHIGQ